MSRHCSSGVATLSYDVLRDVAAYVVAMSWHCSSALPVLTNVTTLKYWSETLHTVSRH